MRGYGQFCPIAKAAEVLGERWTQLVIRELGAGSNTFSDLRKGLPLMSPSLLSRRLKSLEQDGIVVRHVGERRVFYELTPAGKELMPIILQLGVWGHRWIRSDLSEADLDPGLLIWDIHRNLDASFFTAPRTVIRVEFTDIPGTDRLWWLIIRDGNVDVRTRDPGFGIDLTISCTLRVLTAVWMGDTTITKELQDNQVIVTGSPDLTEHITNWLGTSYFANVKAAV